VFPPLGLIGGVGLMVVTGVEERYTMLMLRESREKAGLGGGLVGDQEGSKDVEDVGEGGEVGVDGKEVASGSGRETGTGRGAGGWYEKYARKECRDVDYVFGWVASLVMLLSSVMYGMLLFDSIGDEYGWRMGLVGGMLMIGVYFISMSFQLSSGGSIW
jgi:hypothetical protein